MNSRVVELADMIDKNYSEALNPSTPAERVGLSRRQLDRLFRAETGLTVSGYVKQKRLAEAAELLRTTHLPISEVADQVGWHNASCFSWLFKKHFGQPPGKFRHGLKHGMSKLE